MEILGYAFRDESLLQEALTTPACRMDEPEVRDNQRLEFLGDAVLGLLSAERVFGAFPGEQEGALTVRRTHMVSTGSAVQSSLNPTHRWKPGTPGMRCTKLPASILMNCGLLR